MSPHRVQAIYPHAALDIAVLALPSPVAGGRRNPSG